MFNIDSVNNHVSRKLKIPLKQVQEINDLYYKQLLNELNNYNDSEIKLSYLGVFKARFSPVKRRIWILIHTIKKLKLENQNPAILGKISELKKELSNLWKIKNYWSIINYKKKNGIKLRKYKNQQ